MAIYASNAGTAGEPIPYVPLVPILTDWYETGTDTITQTGWTTGTISVTPDTKEAITILEEAEYELKALLKKTEDTISIGKNPKQLINEALRDTQRALRALLKVG